MEKLVIVGTSSTAIDLYEFITYHKLFEVVGFAVNKEYINADTFCGKPVYPLEELDLYIDKSSTKLFVAILWNKLNSDRRRVYEQLKAEGYTFANVVSPTAIIQSPLNGDNCWINDYVVIKSNVAIGNNCIVRQYVLVGINAKIHDHCFMGNNSTIAGGCIIGTQSFIGMNATIFDNRSVGEKCIVGACSAIKRNLPDFSVIKIATDSMVIKLYSESEIENKLMFAKNVK